jgi:hypothetical protein
VLAQNSSTLVSRLSVGTVEIFGGVVQGSS